MEWTSQFSPRKKMDVILLPDETCTSEPPTKNISIMKQMGLVVHVQDTEIDRSWDDQTLLQMLVGRFPEEIVSDTRLELVVSKDGLLERPSREEFTNATFHRAYLRPIAAEEDQSIAQSGQANGLPNDQDGFMSSLEDLVQTETAKMKDGVSLGWMCIDFPPDVLVPILSWEFVPPSREG